MVLKTQIKKESTMSLSTVQINSTFFAEVDPHDKLDVVAGIFSVKELLMGKGLQIMKGCVSMGEIHVKKTVAFVQKKTAGILFYK